VNSPCVFVFVVAIGSAYWQDLPDCRLKIADYRTVSLSTDRPSGLSCWSVLELYLIRWLGRQSIVVGVSNSRLIILYSTLSLSTSLDFITDPTCEQIQIRCQRQTPRGSVLPRRNLVTPRRATCSMISSSLCIVCKDLSSVSFSIRCQWPDVTLNMKPFLLLLLIVAASSLGEWRFLYGTSWCIERDNLTSRKLLWLQTRGYRARAILIGCGPKWVSECKQESECALQIYRAFRPCDTIRYDVSISQITCNCVGGDVKPCSINQSISQRYDV